MIDEPDVAAAVMEPLRARVLAALCEPGSSTTVAEALGEPRQKVNYHLRALEEKGLVQLVEERPRRGLTERVMVATARSYVVSPAVLGQSAPEPERTDRLSARYLIALAARMVTEVGGLLRKSEAADKSLATLALDTEIRFATASERAAFTHELSEAITELCGKYHDESAPRGRWHRLVVAAHPRPAPSRPPTTTATTTTREAEQ